MPPLPCMLVCPFVSANRTRDRGCSKHPVFPVPSISMEGQTKTQSSDVSRRENAKVYSALKIESEHSSVVPANAGTHSHRPELFCEVVVICLFQ